MIRFCRASPIVLIVSTFMTVDASPLINGSGLRGELADAAWVAASATRNHALGNPLLDWLEIYGPSRGYGRDTVDGRTDFREFIFEQGTRFESAVVEVLEQRIGEPAHVAAGVGTRLGSVECRASTVDTLQAMRSGEALIYQAALADPDTATFGYCDLLIRSDVLAELFPSSITPQDADVTAPALDLAGLHYVAVDIKYTTLRFAAGGGLTSSGSAAAYKTQAAIYNRALGAMQGYLPPLAFLMGRSWQQRQRNQTNRGSGCLERLAPLAAGDRCGAVTAEAAADAAVAWIRQLRSEGAGWDPVEGSVPELRPNAGADNAPWNDAVSRILEATEDLTRLWQIGPQRRDKAAAKGLTRWTDPAVTPESLGMTKPKTVSTLRKILEANRDLDGPALRPFRVAAARSEWINPPDAEFYVDFETVSDLDDDLSHIPARGGQAMVFMIGCGRLEETQWRFECFTAEALHPDAEAAIIEAWFAHMAAVSGSDTTPTVVHWSSHEVTSIDSTYAGAAQRHPTREQNWPRPRWFDLLGRVIKAEPVVVRGAHSFGLKDMTKALHSSGAIECAWDSEGPADGLAAMVAAWRCQRRINDGTLGSLIDAELMGEVRDYNETDCRAMMEILRYLRCHH